MMSKEYAYNSDFDESEKNAQQKYRPHTSNQPDSQVMMNVKMTSDLDSGDLLSVLKSPQRKWKRVQSLSLNTGLLEYQNQGEIMISEKKVNFGKFNKAKGHRRVTTQYDFRENGAPNTHHGISVVSVPAVIRNDMSELDVENELKRWKQADPQPKDQKGRVYQNINFFMKILRLY